MILLEISQKVKGMKRFLLRMVILVYAVLLTGCNNYVSEESSEEIDWQVSVNQAAKSVDSSKKESELTSEKEAFEDKWWELPDIEVGDALKLGNLQSRIYTCDS